MSENVVVNAYRGSAVENRHRGDIAIVNADGQLLYSFGNPYISIYGRSALKPFQVLPLIETGAAERFEFSQSDIAICCASHSGEEQHCSRVRSILHRIGVDVAALRCGVADPIDKKHYEALIRSGEGVSQLCNCCSGVHAGMLATAVHLGEDYADYTELSHPVQQRVQRAVSDMTDTPIDDIVTAVDGCGIPTYLLPLNNLALAYARLAKPAAAMNSHGRGLRLVRDAMRDRPELVTGTHTYTTRMVEVFNGRIVAKEGAQGVYGVADIRTGIGIALKIEDGSPTEIPVVVNRIFNELQIGSDGELEMLEKDTNPALTNVPGQAVGHLEAVFHLRKEQ